MFQVTASGETTDSKYGPIILPNNFADLFFGKAVIEALRGTEIEPSTQTHQTTKIIQLYTTVKPEEALHKYQNLGGYEEKYNSTMATQLHQVPITIGNNGAITATTGADYKTITEAQFIGGTGVNNNFAYMSAGAAKLTKRFNNRQELQFEVPLRRICRVANCQQMFPAGKKFFITLYKAHEPFRKESATASPTNIIKCFTFTLITQCCTTAT